MVRVVPDDGSASGDPPCMLSSGQKLLGVGVCGCVSLAGLITFIIVMVGYKHLGPDEQYLVKSGGKWKAYNGPQSIQTNVFEKSERRKALMLGPNEWVKTYDKKKNSRVSIVGPVFRFMEPDEDIYRQGKTISLERNQYVRIINLRTGAERVERGPLMLYEGVSDNFAIMRLIIKTAVYLDQETAIVVANRQTAKLEMMTYCTPGVNTLFAPSENMRIVDVKKLIHVPPYEALLVLAYDETTQQTKKVLYSGDQPSDDVDFQCAEQKPSGLGKGLSFWLRPNHRIIRFRNSDYSKPPTSATSLKGVIQTAGSRRRRTTRNPVVKGKTWTSEPRTWLAAGDYNALEKFWLNRGTGPNMTKIPSKGTLQANSALGGPAAKLEAVQGNTATKIDFGNLLSSSHWTLCTVTRYTGTGGFKRQILEGQNWYHGHWAGLAGVARYGTNVTQMRLDHVEPDTDWVPMCGKSSGSAPHNILVGDDAVGTSISGWKPTRIYVNNNVKYTSDFAIAEIIMWPLALSDAEMKDAMEYLQHRISDATQYMDDQSQSIGEKKNTKLLTSIDLRTQRSFFKYEMQTGNMVRLHLEGAVYWKIVDPMLAVTGTGDVEGDVWQNARQSLLDVVQSRTLNEFVENFNDALQEVVDENKGATFYTDRGVEFIGIDVTNFYPTDAKVVKQLQTGIEVTTKSMIKAERAATQQEVRKAEQQGKLDRQTARTEYIEAQTKNEKLEAETRGATEGGRKATTVGAFLKKIKLTSGLSLYRKHLHRISTAKQTQNIYNGISRVYMKPTVQKMSLLLPTANFQFADRRLDSEQISPPQPSGDGDDQCDIDPMGL